MTDGKSWFEEESFWLDFAPVMFDEARWAEVPAVVDRILALCPLPPGAKVLDACCGVGRHSIEFASRGFHVTGVDITPSYLEAARESSSSADLACEFELADMREFRRPSSFDLCVNLFTSFGYFEDPSDDRLMLENIRASLKPGGFFVLDTLGKEVAVRDFKEGEWFEKAGATVMTEYSVAGAWEGIENRWILIKGGARREYRFTQRLYSAVELRELLLSTGFTKVSVYGDMGGAPYDQNADNLVIVAAVRE
jgi:SAM-dependent methyltransferase